MSMSNTEKTVKDIRRNTRRKFSTEEKIRIVLDGLRGECSIAELCRREGINPNLYYRWSKVFLEAGKKRLSGDTVREANTDEVTGLKRENGDLKQAVAELYLRNARIEIGYDFPAGWEATMQVDAEANSDGSDVDLGSTYLRYSKWKPADISLGKMKEPLCMERNTRSAKLMTIEAAYMSRAVTPCKGWG